MAVEYLACPRCGNRVDESPEGVDLKHVPAIEKNVVGLKQDEEGDWLRSYAFVYCPHCGAVLGVLDTRR